jgi:hypothetical protein
MRLVSVHEDADLRALMQMLDPKARDHLRRVLIRDQADRDAIASRLMRYRDENGQAGRTSSTCEALSSAGAR